jgi:hypothetical protein
LGENFLPILSDDSRGFAISLDLLIALIPITLILGFVAADMDNLLFQMEDTVFRSSMDRSAGDAMSTLLQTSGDPNNWELNGNPNIVGLAQFDAISNSSMQGTIDPVKLNSLTVPEVQKLVGNDYNFYMNVSIIGSSTPIKTLGSSYAGAKDVVRVQREVQTSKFKVVSKLDGGQITYAGGTRNFIAPTFQTTSFINSTYDYWVYIGNNSGFKSATVNINNNGITFNNLVNGSTNTPIMINSSYLNINGTTPMNNTVLINATGTFPSSMNLYIVQAPKGTGASEINNNTVIPQYSNFIFYLWLKG